MGCRCPLPAAGQAGAACSAGRAWGAEPRGMSLGSPGSRRLESTGVPHCEDAPRLSTGGMRRRDHPAWGTAAKAVPKALGDGAEQSEGSLALGSS